MFVDSNLTDKTVILYSVIPVIAPWVTMRPTTPHFSFSYFDIGFQHSPYQETLRLHIFACFI